MTWKNILDVQRTIDRASKDPLFAAELAAKDPGFEIDLHVHADLAALYEVWAGRRSLRDALVSESVRIDFRSRASERMGARGRAHGSC